jgi:hypothetical protein
LKSIIIALVFYLYSLNLVRRRAIQKAYNCHCYYGIVGEARCNGWAKDEGGIQGTPGRVSLGTWKWEWTRWVDNILDGQHMLWDATFHD